MPTYVVLTTGEPAFWFCQHSSANTEDAFDATAGPYIVLCFFAAANAHSPAATDAKGTQPPFYDDEAARFR